MLEEKEERIRAEAYRRWEEEGRPEGQHDRHWHEATDAVENAGPAAKPAKPSKPRVAKTKAPEAVPEAHVAVEATKRSRAKKIAAE